MNTDALLIEIRDCLFRIERRLASREITDNDDAVLRRLLPAIKGAIGSDVFVVAELLKDPVFQEITDGMSCKAIGGLLGRACDAGEFQGLTVERLGREHNATLWRVVSKLP
jgi:hypothetical protein